MFPEIFQSKYFTLNTLWVFFALAIFAGAYTLIKLTVKNGLKVQFINEHSWGLLISALLGARLFALIQHANTYFYEFSKDTFLQIFYIWDKGLNAYGAIAAILIYLFYITKKHEQDFYKWLDILIPSLIIGLAIGHLGSFFEGINYGRETGLPWGVNFESPSIKYTVPIHPTQIYAFLYSIALGIGLIGLSKTEKFKDLTKPGLIGLIGVTAYFSLQFLEQFVRGDDTITFFSIRLPQIGYLILAILSGIIIFLRYNKRTKKRKRSN